MQRRKGLGHECTTNEERTRVSCEENERLFLREGIVELSVESYSDRMIQVKRVLRDVG